MKELFVLAWHSYAEVEDELDGAIVNVFNTLEEAQKEMKEQVEETDSFYENSESTKVVIEDLQATFQTDSNYFIKYYIQEVTLPEAKETKYKEALEKISKLGSVCSDFELCKHKACTDSAGAVLIALEALKNL
ncbi:MAG: hypothetical protein KDH96_10590 [Candidatus Riesia sp.]|nr:hypothetical protein [Candidatus Riesia sp.]